MLIKSEAFVKWSILKTYRFENAPFLVCIGENERLLQTVTKKAFTYCRFHQRFRAFACTIGKNAFKPMRFRMKTHEFGQLKTKRKRLCRRKYSENIFENGYF